MQKEFDTLKVDSDESDEESEQAAIKKILQKIYTRTNKSVAEIHDKLKLVSTLVDWYCEKLQS